MLRFHPTNFDLPAGPPPEVLQQIDVAWERTRELLSSDLEIHFGVDDELGDICADVLRADGSVLERLSGSEVLELACGHEAPEFPAAA